MNVFLRHASSGFYYRGPRTWVAERGLAMDLGTIQRAVQVSRRAEFEGMEILACCTEHDGEVVVRLHRRSDTGFGAPLSSGPWALLNAHHRL